MQYEDYNLVAYTRGGINKAPTFKKITTIDPRKVDPQMEYYQSIWRYTEDDANHLNRVLRGVSKDIKSYADFLVFDIDFKGNLQKAYEQTVKLADHLSFLESQYEIWFSGNKGFHIMVPTVQFKLEPTNRRYALKNMAIKIASDCNVEIDESIYDAERRLRLPNSWNTGGKRYKVPVTNLHETSLSGIIIEATAQRENPYPEPDDYTDCPALIEIFRESLSDTKINRRRSPIEGVENSTILVPWTEGQRNTSCYKTARRLARRGFGPAEATVMCGLWNDKQEDPLPENEVKSTVKSAYTKGMNEVIDESNLSQSFYSAKRSFRDVIMDMNTPKEGLVKTGFNFIDDYTGGLEKGDVMFYIARTGNLKTCVLSNLMQRISVSTDKPAIFFSMEMGIKPLTKRHMQNAERMTRRQLKDAVKRGYDFKEYHKKYGQVHVVNLSNMSMDSMIGMTDYFLEEIGELSAVGIDYLSLFKGCASDTQNTARVTTEIKTRLAKAVNCPVISLVQARRKYQGQGGNIEIDLQASKDSSSIEDTGDFIFGAWNHTEDNKKSMYGKTLKGRRFNDELFEEHEYFELDIDGPTMTVNSIEHRELVPKFKQAKED